MYVYCVLQHEDGRSPVRLLKWGHIVLFDCIMTYLLTKVIYLYLFLEMFVLMLFLYKWINLIWLFLNMVAVLHFLPRSLTQGISIQQKNTHSPASMLCTPELPNANISSAKHMAATQLVVNNMKTWIHPALVVSGCCRDFLSPLWAPSLPKYWPSPSHNDHSALIFGPLTKPFHHII